MDIVEEEEISSTPQGSSSWSKKQTDVRQVSGEKYRV